jgi:hypothetical protein
MPPRRGALDSREDRRYGSLSVRAGNDSVFESDEEDEETIDYISTANLLKILSNGRTGRLEYRVQFFLISSQPLAL